MHVGAELCIHTQPYTTTIHTNASHFVPTKDFVFAPGCAASAAFAKPLPRLYGGGALWVSTKQHHRSRSILGNASYSLHDYLLSTVSVTGGFACSIYSCHARLDLSTLTKTVREKCEECAFLLI